MLHMYTYTLQLNSFISSRPNADDDQPTSMIFVATGVAMLIALIIAATIFVYMKSRRSPSGNK